MGTARPLGHRVCPTGASARKFANDVIQGIHDGVPEPRAHAIRQNRPPFTHARALPSRMSLRIRFRAGGGGGGGVS